jgi:hypothetical protein
LLTRKHLIAGLVAGVALAGSAVAIAQTAPKPEHGSHDDRRQAMMQRFCADMPAMVAGRLAYAEVKLGITEQQKSAWQTFTRDVKAAIEPAQKACTERAAATRPATPPDAVALLAEREKRLGVMLETTKGLRQAVEKLTPTLTDAQKQEAARMVAHIGHGGFGDRHGHRMMRHHRHGGDANAPSSR